MKYLDAPENGTWLKKVVRRIKNIISWHQQIDDLAKELGTVITADPDHLDKLNKIGKMAADFDIYA